MLQLFLVLLKLSITDFELTIGQIVKIFKQNEKEN